MELNRPEKVLWILIALALCIGSGWRLWRILRPASLELVTATAVINAATAINEVAATNETATTNETAVTNESAATNVTAAPTDSRALKIRNPPAPHCFAVSTPILLLRPMRPPNPPIPMLLPTQTKPQIHR